MEVASKTQLRSLNTFMVTPDLRCGDFVLFQEYSQDHHDGKQYFYEVSRPAFAIFVGHAVVDQAVEFGYVVVQNTARCLVIPQVNFHTEWADYADILGHWRSRPTWKQLLAAYRNQAPEGLVPSSAIAWDMYSSKESAA